jgi:hypothetical protein
MNIIPVKPALKGVEEAIKKTRQKNLPGFKLYSILLAIY